MIEHSAQKREFLTIAKVLRAHGLKGFVEAKSLTDFPERFKPGARVYGSSYDLSQKEPSGSEDAQKNLENQALELILEKAKAKGKNLLLKFEGVTSRGEAENLKGRFLQVPSNEAVPLPKDTYWYHQIVGLKVFTLAGEFIGEITDILKTGSNDVYVISPEGRGKKEILVPATIEVVKEVDLENKRMVIEPLPGLLD